MIGFIITGHGDFSLGMKMATEMISGNGEYLEALPFYENEPLEDFDEKIKTAVEKMLNECESIIIFADLLGGTPFRSAMIVAGEHENVDVIAGVNLPMLVEGNFTRTMDTPHTELVKQLVEVGTTGVTHAELKVKEKVEEEDGI